MTVVSGKEAMNYVESLIDEKIQEQMCGVDLTASCIEIRLIRFAGL